MTVRPEAAAVRIDPPVDAKCAHGRMAFCQLCGEDFCHGCDQYHREACRDANRP